MRATLHRLDRKSRVTRINQYDDGASRRLLFGREFPERIRYGQIRQAMIDDQAIRLPRATQIKRAEAAIHLDNHKMGRRITREGVTQNGAVFRRGGRDQNSGLSFFHIHLWWL